MIRDHLFVAFSLGLLMMIAACGTGGVRDAQMMDDVDTTPAAERAFTGAFDPEDLVAKLEEACATGDEDLYADCLADSFRFVPTLDVIVDYPDIDWDHWNRTTELVFVERLLRGRTSRLDLHSRVLERSPAYRDRAEWDVIYQWFGHVSRAILVFNRVDQRWYLSAWIDTTIEEDNDGNPLPTSGRLRGEIMR